MQSKILSLVAASAMAVVAGAQVASADVVAQYTFEEFTGTATYAPAPGPYQNTASSSAGTASDLATVGLSSLQADTTRDSTQVALNSDTLLIGAGSITSGSTPEPPAPVSSTDYLGFTLAPTSPLDLNSLTFNLGTSIGANQIATNTNGTFDNLETNLQLFYSTDGTTFNAVGPLIESTAVSTVESGSFTGMNFYSIDLSALPDLNVGQTGEFRLAFSDNRGGGTNTMGHYLDNVVLNATVVPEPASLGLLCAAGLGLVARRRR